jgi:hypothetical protein
MPHLLDYPSCQIKSDLAIAPAWNSVCHIAYTRDTWVKLFQQPSDYSADEALLLCQESLDTWVAWVPGHGEILLDRSNFGVSNFGVAEYSG